jgi:hypothetical protein
MFRGVGGDTLPDSAVKFQEAYIQKLSAEEKVFLEIACSLLFSDTLCFLDLFPSAIHSQYKRPREVKEKSFFH